MLYLTGAETSLAKSQVAVQTDPAKSLGGYISSSPVPNAAVNSLFDLISLETLRTKPKETLAFGLINKLPNSVTNVKIKFISRKEDVSKFRVAAVAIGSDYSMEQIPNRYSEPMLAEFYDASFSRASVDLKVTNPAAPNDEIYLKTFDISVFCESGGIEGTWEAFENAFYNDETYCVERVAEDVFRIMRRDEYVVEEPITCEYETEGSFVGEFLGEFKNDCVGEVTLVEDGVEFKSGEAIGLWIQRIVKNTKYESNEKILEDFKNKVVHPQIEEIVLNASYNLYEEPEEEPEPVVEPEIDPVEPVVEPDPEDSENEEESETLNQTL